MSTKKNKFNQKDHYYMNLAFNLARNQSGLTGPNPPVGCVFKTRCPEPAQSCIDSTEPMELKEVSPGHFVDSCCINCG